MINGTDSGVGQFTRSLARVGSRQRRVDVASAQNVIAPRLGERRPVAGPPKRFAQLMGAVMSTGALVLALVFGDHTAADVVLIAFLPAAGLESIVGYCVGCRIFGLLMRAGVVPATVCAECADISLRLRNVTSAS